MAAGEQSGRRARSAAGWTRARIAGGVAGLSQRVGWRERRRTLELYAILAVQAGVAAALAWTVAHNLLQHPSPVFAPTAAVGTIAAAIGRRTRRTLELLLGVLAGLLVGDALIAVIGTGPWQTGTVVTLAILLALTLSRGGQVVTQAGGTAVLIATLAPVQRGLEVPRIIDAVIGGLTAVLVVAVLPVNPVRIIQRAARPLFADLVEYLHNAADGMSRADYPAVARARDELNGLHPQVKLLNDAVSGAQEAVAISPARWHRRAEFEHYERGTRYLELAIRGGQEMLRRATTAIRDGEPVPPGLIAAVHYFGDALALLQLEAESGHHTSRSEQLILKAVDRAAEAYGEGVGFSGSVVVAQVRTVATDLLRSLGCEEEEASAVIRRRFEQQHPAAGRGAAEAGST
ncbi:aromatic acid exporter family protein [Micromonospora zingiberis]|uniref:Aromatic acid exporter family protein n=1 Tax=Micromonospora zingiberis TaxID=2053011 RepID=A0A4R0GDI8_9ACTN|nr:FUSC family protein [Micromonospora zingiberis]TCB93418.1 aromatic acid exporter family protein [Micromonospora zingiberis]